MKNGEGHVIREVDFTERDTTMTREIAHTAGKFIDIHREVSVWPNQVYSHSHDVMELIACREGVAEYMVDARRFRTKPGDFLLILPRVSHSAVISSEGKGRYSRISLRISPEAVKLMQELEGITLSEDILNRRYHLLRTANTRWEYLGGLCERICNEAEHRQLGWASIMYGNVFVLLALLMRALYGDADAVPEQQDILSGILLYVERNLDQKITLADTARRFLVSESYISKLFRSRLDVSFYRYVIRQRLLEARRLIAEEVPLEQIGTQVGFSDHAAFYRAFKREYGISPQQFRQSLSEARLPPGEE